MDLFRFYLFLVNTNILLIMILPVTDANNLEKDTDLSDLERNNNIFMRDIDEPEGRFLNITYAPWVFLLGALATVLLLAIPLALALFGGSGGEEETYGGDGGDAGYGSDSSGSGYGAEYRYFFNTRKKRSSGFDVKINSKCIISRYHVNI